MLAGLNAPLPPYRFQIMAGKATELAQEVRQLGNALLTRPKNDDRQIRPARLTSNEFE